MITSRQLRLLALAWSLGIVSLGLCVAGATAGSGTVWTVTEVSGQASLVARASGPRAVALGDQLGSGQRVETGRDGRVVMVRGKSSATISPDSRTEIPDQDQDGRTTLFQALGALLLKVEKRAEQHFEVQTPYLAAVVKGTTFTVNANQAQSSVHVVEGAVEVGSFATGDVALVRAGQTATVGARADSGVSLLGTIKAAPGQSSEHSSEAEPGDRTHGADSSADGGAVATAAASTPPQAIARAREVKSGFTKGVGLATTARPVVLDRAVGPTKIDVSSLTGGLVRGPASRAQHVNLKRGGAGAEGQAAAKGKPGSKLFKSSSAKGLSGAGGAGRNGVLNPGKSVANLVRATGNPGAPSQAVAKANQSNGRALGLSRGVSQSSGPAASSNNGNGQGNAFGKSEASSNPANSAVASNGNSNSGNNGNGNSGNSGNGNSGNSGNGNSGNNGNGNSGNSGNGNSGNSGNGNSGNSGNGNSGNNGNGNSDNNGNGNSGNNGNGNNGNNGNGNNGNGKSK